MPADILLEINPPVGLDWRWWALAGLLALAAVAVMTLGVLRWRFLGREELGDEDTSLAELRSEALVRIDTAVTGYHAGQMDAQSTCQRVGRAVRWFAGTASDGNADYETATQLTAAARRDPRLAVVATFVDGIQDDCFSPTARPDVDAVAASAKGVLSAWH